MRLWSSPWSTRVGGLTNVARTGAVSECGVILFRGFNVCTPQDFLDVLNAFSFEFGSYVGGGGACAHACREHTPAFLLI